MILVAFVVYKCTLPPHKWCTGTLPRQIWHLSCSSRCSSTIYHEAVSLGSITIVALFPYSAKCSSCYVLPGFLILPSITFFLSCYTPYAFQEAFLVVLCMVTPVQDDIDLEPSLDLLLEKRKKKKDELGCRKGCPFISEVTKKHCLRERFKEQLNAHPPCSILLVIRAV